MCYTLDDVLYIELVAELSANIKFKHIIVQPLGSGVILWLCSLFCDQLKEGFKGSGAGLAISVGGIVNDLWVEPAVIATSYNGPHIWISNTLRPGIQLRLFLNFTNYTARFHFYIV